MIGDIKNSLTVVEPQKWIGQPKCDYKYRDLKVAGTPPRVDKCCLLNGCSFSIGQNTSLVIAPFTIIGTGTSIFLEGDADEQSTGGQQQQQQQYIIGDHTFIGKNCIIKSPIGPNTWVEDNVVIEEDVDIRGCVFIKEGSRVVKGSALSRFSEYSGDPAEKTASLEPSFIDIVRLACEREYGMSVSSSEKNYLPFVSSE